MSKQRINITADGSTTLRISAAKKYITIDNDTDATISVYDNVGMLNPANILYEIKPYSARCYPLEIAEEEAFYTMAWDGTTYPDYFDIMLTSYDTHNNLLYPQASSSNVTLVADSVGIARTNQLPSGLTTAGNLKVRVNENLTQLPANLSGSGNLKVGVSENLTQLPAGLSGYGGLKVTLYGISGYTWHKITFTEAGDSAIIGSANLTLAGWECSGSTTAYPVAGTHQAWKSLNKKDFPLPILVLGSFKMHADAACDVWVCIR